MGLAPGRTGANRTGIPFTGDASGTFLFSGLVSAGFATPTSRGGVRLLDTRITNAVRCLPPGNRPTPAEVRTCADHLVRDLGELLRGGRRRRPVAVLTLGGIAHGATLRALGLAAAAVPFAHGVEAAIGARPGSRPGSRAGRRGRSAGEPGLGTGARLFASYHPSRLNTNTGRLTAATFAAVLARIEAHLDQGPGTRAVAS